MFAVNTTPAATMTRQVFMAAIIIPAMRSTAVTLVLATAAAVVGIRAQPSPSLAILGATLIDGNGGPPVANAVVVIVGGRITAAGPRASTQVPPGAATIDGTNHFVVPGFIDTNVHLSLYGGMNDRY